MMKALSSPLSVVIRFTETCLINPCLVIDKKQVLDLNLSACLLDS